jgi:hypothetical protein
VYTCGFRLVHRSRFIGIFEGPKASVHPSHRALAGPPGHNGRHHRRYASPFLAFRDLVRTSRNHLTRRTRMTSSTEVERRCGPKHVEPAMIIEDRSWCGQGTPGIGVFTRPPTSDCRIEGRHLPPPASMLTISNSRMIRRQGPHPSDDHLMLSLG